VFQILPDGILFHKYDTVDETLEKDSQLLFIRNFPENVQVVDGSIWALYAIPSGRHSYTSTQGATKTIYAYDYGKTPTEDEIKKLKDAAAAQLKVTEAKLEEQRRAADEQCRAAVKAEEVRKAATKAATKQAILKHYQLQAEGGDGFAQMRLGEIYFRGDGIETNIILARKWLSTASTNGYPQVTNLLSEIEANLRPK
jgi:TPR repeat protein